MYQSTTAFGDLIRQNSRTFKAWITIGDEPIEYGIKSIKINGGSNSENDFSIGSVVSQYVDITMSAGNIQIENREFLLEIGMEVGQKIEYVPMGYYTAEKPSTDEGEISFTAYDRIAKTGKAYFSSLPENTDTVNVLKEISESTGINIVTEGLAAIPIVRPDGYTCREVLSYVSQMYGGFAICDRAGKIVIKTYQDAGYDITADRYWGSFKHKDIVFSLEKITCFTGKDESGNDISISVGTGKTGINFSNPFMSQSILETVWKDLKNCTYMPGSVRVLGDPRIDPWDILTVFDLNGDTYKVPAMKLTQSFDGGLTTEVTAVGKSESEQEAGFTGPKTQEMDRYYANLVILKEAMVHKLNVDDAEIEYAKIKELNVVNETVQSLRGQYGEFVNLTTQNFTSITGKINIFESDFSNLKVLLSGSAGIGDLQSIHLTAQNAVLDSVLVRDAMIQMAYIKDLMTGRVSTNIFQVGSDDGGILIQGATQQWRDKNGVVRMQAGRDAAGDFTFSLFDNTGKGVLIDSTGIKPGAIADGLIINDMVADNAAIAGNKLDIASVIRSINGSAEVINSNRIWFDGQGQSLNQVYSQMSSAITNVQTTASSASNTANTASGTANAAADAAQKALETLSGISTLDALGASLDNDAHVVHTNTDGSGGDYGPCCSKITVYLGDTDVSDHATYTITPSSGVAGRWDAQSRTYYVTGMTTDNGYVDIEALYGTQDNYLTTRSGKRLTTRSGKYLLVRSGGSRIRKRFSVSKAPDGKIGLSYSLRCSATAIRKQQDGALVPASLTLTATKNDNGLISSYAGRYKVEESTDGTSYTVKYQSAGAEAIKIYTPSGGGVKSIRCTLYDSGGAMELDVQTIIVLADAEGLAEEIQGVREVVQTTNTRVANIETGLDGIRANISDMTTDLHGLTDNTLLYNVRYNDNGNGTTTLNAVVYKDGKDVTASYPERWYTWRRKTEAGETYLGYGRSITVSNAAYEFGGVTIGRFTTYETRYLTTRSGKRLATRGGKPITIWREN